MKRRLFSLPIALSICLLASCATPGTSAEVAPVDPLSVTDSTAVEQRPLAESEIKPAILNHPRLILKYGSHFLVMDESGLMPAGTAYGYGLYNDDTRYLSSLNMSLNGKSPVLLSASTDEGYAGRFIYGNAADPASGAAEQQIMLKREIVLLEGVYEKITVTNFSNSRVSIDLGIEYGSDFADMFEVRGMGRKRRGQLQKAQFAGASEKASSVVIAYDGLDKKAMSTRVLFNQKASSIDKDRATFKFELQGQESKVINMSVKTMFETGFRPENDSVFYDEMKRAADSGYKTWRSQTATVTTSNTEFNRLLSRSERDIYILRQSSPRGNCLAAGIPWFAVAFGRDQEITSMQTMMFFPGLAREVIDVLAAYQGTTTDSFTEEKPGRIMHELRLGEMARLREIAFVPYFGTVDATPLFLVLVSRYFDQTGDLEFIKKHWDKIEASLKYLETESPSGYLVYGGKPGAALSNQGWKDSGDSVMYADGKLAKAPIALCEVQGYLYTAWSKAARMADLLGHKERARELENRAAKLQKKFLADFWMPEQKCFALALDGDGRQCDVLSSNVGHLLSSGILDQKDANLVADALMRPEMFCGWGVRTLSSSQSAYNPMSYHNGSVWPHDNAMTIEGLCLVDRKDDAKRIMTGLFETAKFRSDMRLPELFCGFSDKQLDRPVWYPVSCAPQAWAAGSVFQMLAGCLGLIPDATNGVLRVNKPSLPEWLDKVEVKGLRVGEGQCDLSFELKDGKTKCTVVSKTDKLKVVVSD